MKAIHKTFYHTAFAYSSPLLVNSCEKNVTAIHIGEKLENTVGKTVNKSKDTKVN